MNTLIKLALLFLTTLTLIACGGGSSGGGNSAGGGGGSAPAPTPTKLTIANAQAGEGSMLNFTVTTTPPIAEPITFDYRIDFEGQTANANDLSSDITGSKTIATTDSSTTISILIRDDDINEPAETFRIVLSNLAPTSDATFTNKTATGTIAESDPTGFKTNLSISDAQASEGESLTFKVTSAQKIAEQITFNYRIDFAGQTANANDLSSDITGNSTITANSTGTTISILIRDDNIKESAETFQIMLSNLAPTSDATFTNKTATGTIAESDPTGFKTNINIADVQAGEGESLTFTVTSEQTIAEQVTFSYQVVFDSPLNPSSATAGDLSGAISGTRVIAANSDSTTISIATVNDSDTEPAETFRVMLSNLAPAGATFSDATGIGTILASDPRISVAHTNCMEGEICTFTVTSTQAITEPITFTYEFLDGSDPINSSLTSRANDFSGNRTGTATINPMDTTTTISIQAVDDNQAESDETFVIVISNSPNAVITDYVGSGIILANDHQLSIAPASASEGSPISFTVTVFPTISEQVTFSYNVSFDGTAIASDVSGTTSGQATIIAGQSSTTININTVDDSIIEPDETLTLQLTSPSSNVTLGTSSAIGTILRSSNISIAPASAKEGDPITFTVTANPSLAAPIMFSYNVTFSGTAIASDVSVTGSGTATIMANQPSTTIGITTVEDTEAEADETFTLQLTGLSNNATFANSSAIGTIQNDDIGEISGQSGTAGTKQLTLNWSNPTSNIFAGVTIAQLAGNTAPGDCTGATITLNNSTESHIITNLADGAAYSFRICARSTAGAHSTGVTVTTTTLDGDDDSDGFMNSVDVDDDNDGLIEISTAAEFTNIRHNLAGTSYKTSGAGSGNARGCNGGACNGYELKANIDLSGHSPWMPIANGSDANNRFTATLNGNNNTISNLTITGSSNIVGLFGAGTNATISNLKLSNVNISGGSTVGALFGTASGTTTFNNIELIGDNSQNRDTAEVRGSGEKVGGLVGEFTGTITNSTSSFTVRGGNGDAADKTGGLVGEFSGGTIRNAHTTGEVSASGGANDVGGLVGLNNGGSILQSSASGNIYSLNNSNLHYGGLVGRQDGANSSIRQSWASGNVASPTSSNGNNASYGGLVGRLENGSISQSWASGNLNTVFGGTRHYGGLVGEMNSGSSIRQVWASGKVLSNSLNSDSRGGLVGGKNGGGTIHGRNYRLYNALGNNVNAAESILLADITALSTLSGTGGTDTAIASNWHAGWDGPDNGNDADFDTMYCDKNHDGTIQNTEQTANNRVWAMPPGGANGSDVAAPTTNEAGDMQNYYWIPAIRCIGNSDTERKANIDRQRRLFPDNR